MKNTFDNLVLFGADAYDATQFLGGCQAMIKMAQMLKDQTGEAQIRDVSVLPTTRCCQRGRIICFVYD